MAQQNQLYANFNEDTLYMIYKQFQLRSSDFISSTGKTLHQMYNTFHGINGELFFGLDGHHLLNLVFWENWFHCAAMENTCLQGEWGLLNYLAAAIYQCLLDL